VKNEYEDGAVFGDLTLLRSEKRMDPDGHKRTHWFVRCRCTWEGWRSQQSIKLGRNHAGCPLSRARSNANLRPPDKTYPGAATHPLYSIWAGMRMRCRTHPRYAGRGIRVCEEWSDFFTFVRDMGERPSPKHSLDRIDNDGDYCPSNCRWATRHQQAQNTSTNITITYKGQSLCLAQAYELSPKGVSLPTAWRRLKNGWPEHLIFEHWSKVYRERPDLYEG
jgi:hypothetical protein